MKKRRIKKRVLAALMTACMVVGSVPGVSLADVETSPSKALGINNPGPNKFMLDGNDYTTGTPDIELNKTATYNSEDGTYTIQLNAKTSDKLTKKKDTCSIFSGCVWINEFLRRKCDGNEDT